MADRQPSSVQTQRGAPKPNSAFLRKLQDHAPNSSQLIGFLTLLISGSVLLIFTGLTVTVTALCFIFFAPLILISSPIWLPIGTILFFCIAGFLSLCGFGVAVIAALSWMYRYFRGLNPPGSDRFDYARSRIYDTASHVKDYASQYGGYAKDAAPGA
ncbi:hypothetical protein I3843_15G105200 [Carya illinoinensis]|uniref:Oleosin n=1 Tax=Carya illinoinensis TaxID=32201 RepID=A0A8T1NEK6_CARIL|nr:oleosin-like [Carya illinoinensis]KAG2667303.1 hypothetical protein I3760_15G107600 [Carya illinoinensis]KAG6627410.1 hypothetical protein CIPAW_15G125600 [Carya illinoinensis]KAG7944488.1 hypothetical protein I3843_15G105200 [Carya illinoinensis]